MIELIAITALIICFIVISFVVRIYKQSPKIRNDVEGDEFNKVS